MRLSAKAIVGYCNINDFSTGNQWTIRAGEPNSLTFQIVDLDAGGMRYLLGVGVQNQPYAVTVVFPSLDNAKTVTAIATQSDPSDSSVWTVALGASQIPSSGNVRFQVVQGTVIRNFSVLNMLSVEHPENEGCDGALPDNGNFTYLP